MSSQRAGVRKISLGDVDAGGSRHTGRRSAVAIVDGTVVVGTAGGSLRGFDASLTEQWTDEGSEMVVSMAECDGVVVAGARGPSGAVRAVDAETGERRWSYETADDVGPPQKETRFFLPFVVDVVAGAERVYVAARRYERRDGERHFESTVSAFRPDGTVDWQFDTDASPIALDADGERVAVAFNRCPGDHQHGLVVLDATTGEPHYDWDPGTDGQRRVGDVSLLDSGLALTSHGDYRGYVLDDGGAVRWRVDLATPIEQGEETLYAYPNHVHATESGVLFVTGNTYPEEGRETEARHPLEHHALGYSPGGDRRWTAHVGGFVSGLGTRGDRVAVPTAQNFRVREADAHGIAVFDVAGGRVAEHDTEGVATAAALARARVAAVEEPVRYHDEGVEHGAYRLHAGTIGVEAPPASD